MRKKLVFLITFNLLAWIGLYGQHDTKANRDSLAIAHQWTEQGKYKIAYQLVNRLLQKHQNKNDKDKHYYASLLFAKTGLEYRLADFSKAYSNSSQLLTIYHSLYKKKSIEVAECLSLCGAIATQFFQLDEAQQYLEQSISIFDKKKKKKLAYAIALDRLGLLLNEKEQLAAAKKYYDKSLAIKLNLVEEKHSILASSYYHLGEWNWQKDQIEEAQQYLKKAQEILEKNEQANHADLAVLWNHWGRFYDKNSEFEKAEEAYQKAIAIRAEHLGKNNFLYARLLANYGKFQYEMGQLAPSEISLLEAKSIYEKIDYQKKLPYKDLLNYLALLYEVLDFSKSKAIHQQALKLSLELPFIQGQTTAFNNLAYVYEEENQMDSARICYQTAIRLWKEHLDTLSIEYATYLSNLAYVWTVEEKFLKAEQYYLRALNIVEKTIGKNNVDYSIITSNLAGVYQDMEQTNKAEEKLLEAAAINRDLLGSKHPDYVQYDLFGLAIFYKKNAPSKASKYFTEAVQAQLELIQNYYATFDEATRLHYLRQVDKNFDHFFYFVSQNPKDSLLNLTALNTNLNVKNLALEFEQQNKWKVLSAQNTNLQASYTAWQKARSQLGNAYLLTTEEKNNKGIDIAMLKEKTIQLEKQFTRQAALFQTSPIDKVDFFTLQKKLQAHEVVIDINTFKSPNGQQLYYAFIIQSNQQNPNFVFLGREKDFQPFLTAEIKPLGTNYIEDDYIGHLLYQKIWMPLLPFLNDISTIHWSVSGIFHQIAISALPVVADGTQRLTDHYQFIYHSNLRHLDKAKNNFSEKSIHLFGGALFDLDSLQLEAIKKNKVLLDTFSTPTLTQALVTRNLLQDSMRNAVHFSYLPGTQQEVNHLKTLFHQKNWEVQLFTQEQALEDNLKKGQNNKAPDILHLATHGYFFSASSQATDNSLGQRIAGAQNALFRSGLVFSGANYFWKTNKSILGLDDGVLTAYEVAGLNLQQTDLVVLSACDTGKGDINYKEGVFGLQRAFQSAGVRQMLVSLWKVPDAATIEFMNTFYTSLLKEKNTTTALQHTQQQMKKKHTPFYWAGFILIE